MYLRFAAALLLTLSGCGTPAGPPLSVAAAATVTPTPAPAPPAAPVQRPVAHSAPAVEARPLNDLILSVVSQYAADTQHPYVWARGVDTDGVTRELLWQGTVLAEPDADGGIHCSGITYEVYLRALALAGGEERGPDAETLRAMKDTWYVRDGDEQGPVDALVKAGLGDRVSSFAALKPGDIVQFWRNSGKGHSVIFIRHTLNSDGSLHGMIYWSAQGTSGGVGMRRVSAGSDINQITPGRLYGVRALRPSGQEQTAQTGAQPSPGSISGG